MSPTKFDSLYHSGVQLPTLKCMALKLNKSVSEEFSVLWKVI